MTYVRDDTAAPGFFDLPDHQLWDDLPGAYSGVLNLATASPQQIGAWKLGGTTPLTQKIFNVTELYFGPIYNAEIFEAGAALTLPLTECKVELEIACRIQGDLPGRGVTSLVADRCAAGALILGTPQPIETIANAPASGISLTSNGQTLTTGGTDGLTDTPLNIARRFLTIARAHGFAPQSGQWIATGGMTPCVEVPRQGQYAINGGPSFTLDLS